jgi:hypothetical protein
VTTIGSAKNLIKGAIGTTLSQFENHRWTPIDEGITLRNKIGNELLKEYLGSLVTTQIKPNKQKMITIEM